MGRRQRNRVKTKKGMWVVVVFAVVICGVMVVNQHQLKKTSSALEVQQEQLQDKIKAAKAKSTQLDNQETYMQTDKFVEEVAREKLGMVKDDEILFKARDKQ